MSYPFASIEPKWQSRWLSDKTFRTPESTDRPKYYVLDMFPYPSGAGLHVGHPEGYTATDIIARYKRMRGFNVLHPMGWDSFGLPAERYAMQTKIHPAETTRTNIDNFRRQLQSLGFSYDWGREIATTEPDYYRWTQWIFLKLFGHYYDEESRSAKPIDKLKPPVELKGKERVDYINSRRLAYVAEMPVNWCAGLGTVLANEEVEEWTSKGYTVERRPMRQWMLRITAYADRLLDDLAHVEWPNGTLELQKNWIGRSEGAEVAFALASSAGKPDSESIDVFTTRPDTLFGATYMVLAPEHPLVERLTSKEQSAAVEKYRQQSRLKSELERQVLGEKQEKSGVFTGGYAINPVNGAKLPVWIADYVLMSYGTGAIMAVPAHDERDFAFAKRFELPIIAVVSRKKPSPEEAAADPASAAPVAECFSETGYSIHSGFLNTLPTAAAKAAMIDHLEREGRGKRRINYRLRDWLFSRQRYWGEPIPISFAEDGSYVAADTESLPLLLPPSSEFQPAESGESPLARLPEWVEHEVDKRKLRRETNTMPQWAGSCWYYLRFIDPFNQKALIDPEAESYWMGESGVDLYVGGAEHAVLHLLYARFWHKFLYDLGVVKSIEPFRKLIHQGLILGEDGQKMSKSRGNVVNPDEVVREYGADAFRLYEMFLGPLEQMKPWQSRGIEGVARFLDRVWRLYTSNTTNDNGDKGATTIETRLDPELLIEPEGDLLKRRDTLIHKTIAKVTDDIERMSFNTAISQMMVFVNDCYAEKRLGREGAMTFLQLLHPFAPHIAEELWAALGQKESIQHSSWPEHDPAKIVVESIEVVFQVNGKIRARAEVAPGVGRDKLESLARSNEAVAKMIDGKSIKKVIVVPDKLVNIVAV